MQSEKLTGSQLSLHLLEKHKHTQPFYGPFSRTTRVSRCQKNLLLDFYCAREDNRGKHTDHMAGSHSIQTNQWPTLDIPHFYTGCPSCRKTLPLYPGLGQAPNMLNYTPSGVVTLPYLTFGVGGY